ncbi:uncharacterized protein LOC123547016 [Mercenaria mercenaria]|uniref:uncharacterized protein LOC123547016 n=1 Tax=Mercenaria mercenaria TaxID=6596 RepID=UPI00234EF4EF|nr:uncharacterized protein LOC123547016 [Mercenaria mercenaria]
MNLRAEMSRDGKSTSIGGEFLNVAKKWLLAKSEDQQNLNREEKSSNESIEQHELSEVKNPKSRERRIFDEDQSSGMKHTNSLNFLESINKFEANFPFPVAHLMRRGSRQGKSKPVSVTITPLQSELCWQTDKKFQISKDSIVPAINTDEKLQYATIAQDENACCCPTCGQRWQRDTPETVIRTESDQSKWEQSFKGVENDFRSSTLIPLKKHQQSKILRSNSFGQKRKTHIQIQNTTRSCRMIKAASMMDDQIRSTTKQSKQKVRTTGSKETKSTLSLTRCLSLNLDTFRIVKSDSLKTAKSENAQSMTSLKTQKRCIKAETSFENNLDGIETASCTGIDDDIIKYSPKITRETKFVNGCPVDEFKTIFDSESFRVPSVYGQLKIMFQFFNDTSEFQVTILEGSNVAVGQTGNLGVYIKVCLMPGKVQRKIGSDKHNTRNPVFYESFTFKMSLAQLLERQLRIKLFNKPGIFSIPEPIGLCNVPLYNYDLTAVNVIWQNLNRCKGQKDDMDEFDFSILERERVQHRRFKDILCGLGGR